MKKIIVAIDQYGNQTTIQNADRVIVQTVNEDGRLIDEKIYRKS